MTDKPHVELILRRGRKIAAREEFASWTAAFAWVREHFASDLRLSVRVWRDGRYRLIESSR